MRSDRRGSCSRWSRPDVCGPLVPRPALPTIVIIQVRIWEVRAEELEMRVVDPWHSVAAPEQMQAPELPLAADAHDVASYVPGQAA